MACVSACQPNGYIPKNWLAMRLSPKTVQLHPKVLEHNNNVHTQKKYIYLKSILYEIGVANEQYKKKTL